MENQRRYAVNVRFLPPGIYFFQIKSGDKLVNKKFIKE
ncbi:MAG: T9SS type A sorting domain-containing protein [Saprospiraceae bacterium]